jgi:hypothetical protein
MTSVRPRGLLNSDDLCVVASAFESALADVGDSTSHITPDSARRVLASFIIDRALAGERDPRTLKQEALRLLGITHSQVYRSSACSSE